MTDAVNITTDTDLSGQLGQRARQARRALGLSQDQLALRAGVSKGTIVHIEQGRANPSISSLCKLAGALQVSLDDLVSWRRPAGARIARPDEARLLWSGPAGGTARLLIAATGPDMLEFWSWRLLPGERYESEGHGHGTREILNVRSGVLRLEESTEVHLLAAGESVLFSAAAPHAYAAAGENPVLFSMVVHEPGRTLT
jgi:transcriptional regulator with XRE-family HTH domain